MSQGPPQGTAVVHVTGADAAHGDTSHITLTTTHVTGTAAAHVTGTAAAWCMSQGPSQDSGGTRRHVTHHPDGGTRHGDSGGPVHMSEGPSQGTAAALGTRESGEWGTDRRRPRALLWPVKRGVGGDHLYRPPTDNTE